MPDQKPDKDCTLTLEDGTHFDFTQLSSGAKDYEAMGGKYFLNVCRGVKKELSHVEEPGKVGGFFERPDERGHFSIGEFSTNLTVLPGSRDPLLVYQHGSPCPGNDKEFASTAIRFICSQTDFKAGQPNLVATLPAGDDACHFFFEWKTHVACPTSQRASLEGSHVLTFFTFIFVALLTWFGGHTLYNRFALGRRGLDQFPIPRSNCTKPRVRLDHDEHGNATSSSGRRRWGFRRSQRAGYSHLRTEPDEEDALAASRFSLEDDEDIDNDARALGGEVNAWRGQHSTSSPRASQEGTLGVHQGLVNI